MQGHFLEGRTEKRDELTVLKVRVVPFDNDGIDGCNPLSFSRCVLTPCQASVSNNRQMEKAGVSQL
jgi:hypothetical protein